MRDTELYHHLLGIEDPWRVINVELDVDEETVRVFIDFDTRNGSFCCPECGKYANLYDRRETRSWRHLDSCQFKTYLVASLIQSDCFRVGNYRRESQMVTKYTWGSCPVLIGNIYLWILAINEQMVKRRKSFWALATSHPRAAAR